MIPLLVPIGLGLLGGYLSQDSVKTYAGGGSTLLAPNGKASNLTPEQYKLVRTTEFKAWFGDWENDPENASKVVDENGEPLVVYHGSRSTVNFAFSKFNVPSEGVFFTSDLGTARWFSGGDYAKYHFEEVNMPPHLKENSKLKDLEKLFKTELDPTAFIELVKVNDGSTYYRLYEDYERESTPLGSNVKDAQKKLYKIINYRIQNINNREIRPLYKVFLNIKNPYLVDAKGKPFYETPFEKKNYSAVSVISEIKMRDKNDGVIIYNTIEGTDNYYNKISNTYNVFNSNQIKLADGTNTTFDTENPDIRYDDGGKVYKGGAAEGNELEKIANNVAKKIHCDIKGSCVGFAELFVLAVYKKNPKLLNTFDVIEGYVIEKSRKLKHTWIKTTGGEYIDPTFAQFKKDSNYDKKIKSKYSGKRYFDDTIKFNNLDIDNIDTGDMTIGKWYK